MSFREEQPGLFVVRYETPEDMLPSEQSPLIEALRNRLKAGRVGIVFLVGASVRHVRIEVPAFWLGVTRELSLTAMAVVSSSAAVQVAARGFDLANRARRLALRLEVFEEELPALLWMRQQLQLEPVSA